MADMRKFDPDTPLLFKFLYPSGKSSSFDITARDLDWFIRSVKPTETYEVFYREEKPKDPWDEIWKDSPQKVNDPELHDLYGNGRIEEKR